MKNLRKWGEPPYTVAVIHGGPGMPGSVAEVARSLSDTYGVLEPFQSEKTLDGQIEELKSILESNAALPIVMIGWSHGATLSCMFSARYPDIVKKLIIIGTSPFGAAYQAEINTNRLLQLTEQQREEFLSIARKMQDPVYDSPGNLLKELVRSIDGTAAYELLPYPDEIIEYQTEVNVSIGLDYQRLLKNDELLKIVPEITCPVVAIHGNDDVLPAEGVKEAFALLPGTFKFITLEKCGHTPWYEKYARETFFSILRDELNS